jgi:hypothetical protein
MSPSTRVGLTDVTVDCTVVVVRVVRGFAVGVVVKVEADASESKFDDDGSACCGEGSRVS